MMTVDEWLQAPCPTLMVVAHPDDETVGAGAQLQRLPELTIMHLTDGAPRDPYFAHQAGCATREEYAAVRAGELDAALRLGQARARRVMLGFVDQEAALNLQAIVDAILETIARERPAVVLTHPYEGGHPDHDAAAFAVATAIARSQHRPAHLEMAFYNDRGDGAFLPDSGPPDVIVPLAEAARARKQAMFAAFPSQAHVLKRFPVDSERFRTAPRYDFSRPPHEGTLYYERHNWGLDGKRFLELCATLGQGRAG